MLETLTYNIGSQRELHDLQERVASLNNHSDTLLRRIADMESQLREFKKDKTIAEKLIFFIESNINDFPENVKQTEVYGGLLEPGRYLKAAERELQNRKQKYADSINELRVASKRLDEYKINSVSITLDELKDILGTSDKVDPDSIVIESIPGEFSYVIRGVLMTPSSNPFPYLNEGKNVHRRLPDIRISINMESCTVYFRYADEQAQINAPCLYSSVRTPHPHVIHRSGRACLGDFSTIISECFADRDISTLALVAQSFLEQADSNDVAGQYWPRLFKIASSTNQRGNRERRTTYLPYNASEVGHLIRIAKTVFTVDDEGIVHKSTEAEHFHQITDPETGDITDISLTRREYLAFRRDHPTTPPVEQEDSQCA